MREDQAIDDLGVGGGDVRRSFLAVNLHTLDPVAHSRAQNIERFFAHNFPLGLLRPLVSSEEDENLSHTENPGRFDIIDIELPLLSETAGAVLGVRPAPPAGHVRRARDEG